MSAKALVTEESSEDHLAEQEVQRVWGETAKGRGQERRPERGIGWGRSGASWVTVKSSHG